jgi:hypothetical protein
MQAQWQERPAIKPIIIPLSENQNLNVIFKNNTNRSRGQRRDEEVA